jgi:MFS family permease
MGSALNYILLHETRESERTASQGVITLSISVGQLLGAASVGAVVASLGGDIRGYSIAFYGIAGFVAVLTVLAVRLNNREIERSTLR